MASRASSLQTFYVVDKRSVYPLSKACRPYRFVGSENVPIQTFLDQEIVKDLKAALEQFRKTAGNRDADAASETALERRSICSEPKQVEDSKRSVPGRQTWDRF